MTVKRSRMACSPGFGWDGSVLNLQLPSEVRRDRPEYPRPKRSQRVSMDGERSLLTVLTLLSPEVAMEKEKESDQRQIGNFLEKCHFCSKRLSENDEVFMYGYLSAFCTPECRSKQITFDKLAELRKILQQAEEKTVNKRMDDVKDHIGSQLGHVASKFHI